MTVRLRAHHLLCMLTYVGKGYTPGFTVNYDRVAARLNGGEDIEIVSGPDDICAPLLDDRDAHCFGDSVVSRDDAALRSAQQWLGMRLAIGMRFTPDRMLFARLRSGFQQGDLRTPCQGCQWSDLCDRVAMTGFPDVRIAADLLSDISP